MNVGKFLVNTLKEKFTTKRNEKGLKIIINDNIVVV